MFVFTPNAICTIGAHVCTSQYQRAIPVEVVGASGKLFHVKHINAPLLFSWCA